jgi:hypothetical protein
MLRRGSRWEGALLSCERPQCSTETCSASLKSETSDPRGLGPPLAAVPHAAHSKVASSSRRKPRHRLHLAAAGVRGSGPPRRVQSATTALVHLRLAVEHLARL